MKFWIWLAYRLPHPLVMWCGIRLWNHACEHPWHQDVQTITMKEVMTLWDAPEPPPDVQRNRCIANYRRHAPVCDRE